MRLAERVEAAALREVARFFAETLRRQYRITPVAAHDVVRMLVRTINESGTHAQVLAYAVQPETEDMLEHVYVCHRDGGVHVVFDDEDAADVTFDEGVAYYRLRFACDQAKTGGIRDARIVGADFAHIAAYLCPPERVLYLPR